MRFSLPLLLASLVFSVASLAQDIRYVGGEQAIALRGGAGEDYPVVYRGIPPGTRLTVAGTSDDGLWAEITADNGTIGWIPTQSLVLEVPAPTKPAAAAQGVRSTSAETATKPSVGPASELSAGVTAQTPDPAELLNRITTGDAEFNAVAQELHQLKQVSGKAIQLDIDNHRLVEETENLRSEVEMLRAENQRLLDRLDSEDFMNGALAVLLGVIIALIAPRLVPQRRKNSGWN